ncbi:hypothetical protein BESB_082040 [Besnoitia besnoiti]|uniref:SRS domain-containing protein n=1 Tax=Besnoitia besnoiti TaxID=94643 RepID=A0A2A9M4W3_BESBE|nr:hypothetical protein BESB_082040 [Besnoitia besnoiti]PFH33005.1 hypothetical protein BESB_082040 [Besnoitia besnoiti]
MVYRGKMNKTASPRWVMGPALPYRGFSLLLTLLGVLGAPLAVACFKAPVARGSQECTASSDAILVFEVEDTAKVFKCPSGWELVPEDVTRVCQQDNCNVELDSLVSGAKLDRSSKTNAFTLTLPPESKREQRLWYYTCKVKVSHSGDEPDSPHSEDANSSNDVPGNGQNPSPGSQGPAGAPLPEEPDSEEPPKVVPPESSPTEHPTGSGVGDTSINNSLSSGSVNTAGSHASGSDLDGSLDDTERLQMDSGLDQPANPAQGLESRRRVEAEVRTLVQLSDVDSLKGVDAFAVSLTGENRMSSRGKREECRVTVYVVPSVVMECNAGETKAAAVFSVGNQVSFRCGPGLKLEPVDLDYVFNDHDGLCSTVTLLSGLLRGSLIPRDEDTENEGALAEYVFHVDELPPKPQPLCYKCVQRAPATFSGEQTPDSPKACFVKIIVDSGDPAVLSLATTFFSTISVLLASVLRMP